MLLLLLLLVVVVAATVLAFSAVPFAVAASNRVAWMLVWTLPAPFFLVYPMVLVSTQCKGLIDDLNLLRVGGPGPACVPPAAAGGGGATLTEAELEARAVSGHGPGLDHAAGYRVESLRSFLQDLNMGQGLGFPLFGKIITVQVLSRMASASTSAMGTLIGMLVGFGEFENTTAVGGSQAT